MNYLTVVLCFKVDFAAGNEECDSGMTEDNCCNAATCKLVVGAECSDSVSECCRNCNFLGGDHICYESKNIFDRKEYVYHYFEHKLEN